MHALLTRFVLLLGEKKLNEAFHARMRSSLARRAVGRCAGIGHRQGPIAYGFMPGRVAAPGERKHGRKRKLLIEGFVASPPEPLRVSEFQAPYRTRLID